MSTEAPQTTRQVVETVLLDPQERRKLVGFARGRYGIQFQDAEDLLQETALDLLRQRQYVHSPRGFVFAVFDRRCSHFIRDRRVREKVLESSAESREPVSDPGPARLDCRLAIRHALGGISSTCRKLLAAHYVQGQSLRETAATMTLAHSGVSTAISRCLRRLRACLS
jgi:RNA polymerase sigma factor (sigma-70 family)